MKSFVDGLAGLYILEGGGQGGESLALEGILGLTSGSQGQTVGSLYIQISLRTDCMHVTSSKELVLICIHINLPIYFYYNVTCYVNADLWQKFLSELWI